MAQFSIKRLCGLFSPAYNRLLRSRQRKANEQLEEEREKYRKGYDSEPSEDPRLKAGITVNDTANKGWASVRRHWWLITFGTVTVAIFLAWLGIRW